MELRCVVERITFQSPETGYTVLKASVKSYTELVTVVGNLLDVNVGSVLLVQGDWRIDARYGRQFQAQSWQETLPATVYGIEKYLGSGLIRGIGPKFAKKIVQEFGTATIDIIDTQPRRLLEVPGIGKKRVDQIIESWERQREVKNIMIFLQDQGVSTAFAAKIYRQYGNESISAVRENPYRLADEIWGIGFKTADQIAEKLGVLKNDHMRCRSGILYTLGKLTDEGHVFAEHSQLIEKATGLLETDAESLEITLQKMLEDQDVLTEQGAIYLPAMYYAEKGVASRLLRLARTPNGKELRIVDVSAIEERLGMRYDEVQADAIRGAVSEKIMILTGGPGTGKTTTTQGIIAALGQFDLKILLAAPTGRAAKRMTEATGMDAKTIHRLLEYKPPEGWQRNENLPLEGDVLIVDECSMIDLNLMNALLRALPPEMKLILVGDIDQLPSVGAGNVLRDLIDSGLFPVVRLTKIFRQAQSSRIIMNAHRINRGQFPDLSNGRNTDFFFIESREPETTAEQIVALVKSRLPAHYGLDPSEIQVLTPMQRGAIGAVALNRQLQAALNPGEDRPCLYRAGVCYRMHDKVMQIRNNYDKLVFNGDIGSIVAVDTVDRTLTACFDGRNLTYDVTELDEMVLAYATTIHKAQGSEYPVVVMPVMMSHYVMLQRNLIYTGITRAKKIFVLVGQKQAIHYAVNNVTVTKRNSYLKQRLTGELAPIDHETGLVEDALIRTGDSVARVLKRLDGSAFRARFALTPEEQEYVQDQGVETIERHARDFIRSRLAPAEIPNDGKQTPTHGHPVFKAQHATATCCRGCLAKWHRIPEHRELTEAEQDYVVDVIMEWIGRRMKTL